MTNSTLPNRRVTHHSFRPRSSYALSAYLPLAQSLFPRLLFLRYLAISFEVLEGELLIRAYCFHCPETRDAINGLEGKKEEAGKKKGKGLVGKDVFNILYPWRAYLPFARI